MTDWEADEMAAWVANLTQNVVVRPFRDVDTRTALQKALDADESPEYAIPAIRSRALRYADGGERVFTSHWRYSCPRTWKRFRATQYRVKAVG